MHAPKAFDFKSCLLDSISELIFLPLSDQLRATNANVLGIFAKKFEKGAVKNLSSITNVYGTK